MDVIFDGENLWHLPKQFSEQRIPSCGAELILANVRPKGKLDKSLFLIWLSSVNVRLTFIIKHFKVHLIVSVQGSDLGLLDLLKERLGGIF